jgi:hypothetical protein
MGIWRLTLRPMRIVLEEVERATLLGPVNRDVAPHQIDESKARRLRALELQAAYRPRMTNCQYVSAYLNATL